MSTDPPATPSPPGELYTPDTPSPPGEIPVPQADDAKEEKDDG